jgi:hypothetical protein
MANERQIQANRRNAALSSGPQSPQGKAISAANAVTHGFCARNAVLPSESSEDYQALLESPPPARRLGLAPAPRHLLRSRRVTSAPRTSPPLHRQIPRGTPRRSRPVGNLPARLRPHQRRRRLRPAIEAIPPRRPLEPPLFQSPGPTPQSPPHLPNQPRPTPPHRRPSPIRRLHSVRSPHPSHCIQRRQSQRTRPGRKRRLSTLYRGIPAPRKKHKKVTKRTQSHFRKNTQNYHKKRILRNRTPETGHRKPDIGHGTPASLSRRPALEQNDHTGPTASPPASSRSAGRHRSSCARARFRLAWEAPRCGLWRATPARPCSRWH